MCKYEDNREKRLLPHHIINHLPYGNLQRSQRLMSRQDVCQPREAEHARHCKQHLCNQLRVLLTPVVPHCTIVS